MASRNGGEATSQQHGKIFERFVRDSGRFPSAIGSKASPTDAIDINAGFDKELSIHTSVKIVGDGDVGLADAVRFYEIDRPFRIIVGHWKQVTPEFKHVTTIHEVIVTPMTLDRLRGSITLDEIKAMQKEYARLPAGPVGKAMAREASDRMKRTIRDRKGLVGLNFKADGLTQRRLQLSIRLKTLLNAVDDDPFYTHGGTTVRTRERYATGYFGSELPLEIESTPRRFFDPDASPQTSLDLGAVAPQRIDASSTILKPRLYVRSDDRSRTMSMIARDRTQLSLLP